MNPINRILRTVLQVLVAVGIVLPALVALLDQAGVTVDGAALAGLVAAAVVLVTTVQNALEQTGLIPTVGAPKD